METRRRSRETSATVRGPCASLDFSPLLTGCGLPATGYRVSRDHRKLRVFQLADELVLEVYLRTRAFPVEERYGLQSQIRRGAVSVPTNIVEGCSRASTKDYLRFIEIALGSACEVRYLLAVANRLGYLPEADWALLAERYDELVRSLQNLSTAFDRDR